MISMLNHQKAAETIMETTDVLPARQESPIPRFRAFSSPPLQSSTAIHQSPDGDTAANETCERSPASPGAAGRAALPRGGALFAVGISKSFAVGGFGL